jgi:4-aminobutyrate aminotransferase-like enzyme
VIDRARLAALRRREDAQFLRRTPRSRELQRSASAHLPLGVPMSWMAGLYRTAPIYVADGAGASFTDVDANRYLDFNLCDLSMTVGYGNAAVAEALRAQASRGAQYHRPAAARDLRGPLSRAYRGDARPRRCGTQRRGYRRAVSRLGGAHHDRAVQ